MRDAGCVPPDIHACHTIEKIAFPESDTKAEDVPAEDTLTSPCLFLTKWRLAQVVWRDAKLENILMRSALLFSQA